jgi:lysophospholipase L1-like esterase
MIHATFSRFATAVLLGLTATLAAPAQTPPAPPSNSRPNGAKTPPTGKQNHPAPVTIVLVGDSTVATEGGWGPGFCAAMTPNVTCIDDALNGRTTKSFIDQGAWKKALDRHGNYYLIQFGHNDQKPAANLPVPVFKDYLQRYIDDVRAIGAIPVLVTSLSRRTFKDGKVFEDLAEYVAATKEVGTKNRITVIDLNALSTALLNRMTQAEADNFDRGSPDPTATGVDAVQPGKLDRTHLNPYGQKVFGRMMADEIARTRVELAPDVVPAATPK